jgi:hypothetical protein
MQKRREKVRMFLAKYCLTYGWLINELEKQNVSVSTSELSDILNYRRRGKKADTVINKSIEILEKYVRCYAEA